MVQSGAYCSGVMSHNIWGAIFARERSDRAVGGFPPPTVGSFFIFRLENVQSGAYLYIRRKFRLDDMYYIVITCMELKINHGLIIEWGRVWDFFLHFHNLKLLFQ